MTQHDSPSYRTPSSFVSFRLARLQSSLAAQGAAILKAKAGLSLVEWRVIQSLRMFENASMTEIARQIQIDKGQLSRKCRSMVEKGLLRVERDKRDQRIQHLQLTQLAEDISREVMPVMAARQRRLLNDVSPEDLETFYSVVEKIEAASQDRNFV